MPTLAQYRLEVRRLLHDATGRYWSNDELNSYINDGRTRTCSDTGCLRSLVSAYLTAGREQYAFGSVTGASIVSGGTGYTTPTLIFSGGNPVVPAAATATVVGGVITAINFTEYGAGYESAPTISVDTGAGEVTGLTVTAAGLGYWTPPVLGFTGGGGTGAAGTASLKLLSCAKDLAGSGYAMGDVVTVAGGTFTRAATITPVFVAGVLQGWEVLDGGAYSVPPGTQQTFGGVNFTNLVNVVPTPGTGARLICYWGVGAATVTSAGTGYTSAPAVGLSGGTPLPGGAAITATAAPGGPGTGASILASVIPVETLDMMNITPIWGNQRVPLNYMPWTEFNAKLRTFLPNPQLPRYWSRYGSNLGQSTIAFLGPVPDQGYTTEFDTAILPDPLVSDNDVDILGFPYSSPVAYYACWKAKAKQQAFTEGEIFLNDYKRKIVEAQAGISMRRIPNPYGGYTGA